MKSSTLNTDAMNASWGGGRTRRMLCPLWNSCAEIQQHLHGHQLQKPFLSPVYYTKAHSRKRFCLWLSFEASLAERGSSFYLLVHCCDIYPLCLLRLNKSKWKFTFLSPQYIINSPCCSAACSSNQWLRWSLLTPHICKKIRSKYKIIFNNRFFYGK